MPWHERRNDACFFLCHWCSLGDSLQPGHGCRHLCISHTVQAASAQGLLSLEELRSPLPCPAQLHIHCAWEIHSYCNWGNEDWENTLRWTQPGSVFVVQTLHLWVATDCLQLRGELLLKYPDTVEQYQAWNRDGVSFLPYRSESGMWKVKRRKVTPCVLVGFCMRGVAIFTFFMLCLSVRPHSVSKGYFARHQFWHYPGPCIPNKHLI